MDDTDAERCANRGCDRRLVRAATGRRAKYCSSTCRVQAKRDRDRQAEEAAARAETLRHARNALEDLGPTLAEAVHGRHVPQILAALYSAATDPARPKEADLEGWINALMLEVNLLTTTARQYRAALNTVVELDIKR